MFSSDGLNFPVKNQAKSSVKNKGKHDGIGNSRRGKSLKLSLKRMGKEIDKGHVGRFLENDSRWEPCPSEEILEIKMCPIRRYHPSVRKLNHQEDRCW